MHRFHTDPPQRARYIVATTDRSHPNDSPTHSTLRHQIHRDQRADRRYARQAWEGIAAPQRLHDVVQLHLRQGNSPPRQGPIHTWIGPCDSLRTIDYTWLPSHLRSGVTNTKRRTDLDIRHSYHDHLLLAADVERHTCANTHSPPRRYKTNSSANVTSSSSKTSRVVGGTLHNKFMPSESPVQ